MARHSKSAGRTVYTVVPKAEVKPGAHRAEDDKVPLAHRVSAIVVAAGVAAGTAAIANAATSGSATDLASGAAELGSIPDTQPAVKTVHDVNPGGEVGRLLQFQQMYAMQTFEQASKIAKDAHAQRLEAARVEAERQIEMRKPAKQREVEGWIKEAIKVLQANGTNIDNSSVDEIYTIIIKESNGNPNAVNNWDSNALRGTPSKGLMQCIDPTFRAYKLPGYDNILAPVDNIIAGVRYTYARYGGFHNHPGLVNMNLGGGYLGY
ncbi:lytic transglycosylase [Nocardia sp. NRRL S-836]|nr:lytic transglycosylase [Nocardia sp. NRRL S-836]